MSRVGTAPPSAAGDAPLKRDSFRLPLSAAAPMEIDSNSVSEQLDPTLSATHADDESHAQGEEDEEDELGSEDQATLSEPDSPWESLQFSKWKQETLEQRAQVYVIFLGQFLMT